MAVSFRGAPPRLTQRFSVRPSDSPQPDSAAEGYARVTSGAGTGRCGAAPYLHTGGPLASGGAGAGPPGLAALNSRLSFVV